MEEIRFDNIIIDPFLPELMQPSSYDVRLDSKFRVLSSPSSAACLDPALDNANKFDEVEVPKGSAFALDPGAFVLGSTYEGLSLGSNIAARLEGKSSLGRLGLLIHTTAGFIDPGFDGQVTLELANLTGRTILLYPGMKIGQLCFFRLLSPTTILYGSRAAHSHYQHQQGPTTSRSYENFKVYDVYPVDESAEMG
jgi:dCTP deaminase